MCRTAVMLAILTGHSAAAADNEYVYAFKGEQYPEAPFVMTVALDRDAARLGDIVRVTYRLAKGGRRLLGATRSVRRPVQPEQNGQ